VAAPVVVLVALLAGWAVDTARNLARLPGRIAVHFGASGAADGWMTPRQFALMDAFILAVVVLVMLAGALSTRFLPARMINVPHRQHWFAPERARASRDRLLRHMLWFCCLVVAFVAFIDHAVFVVNLRPGPPRLGAAELALPLVGFLLVLVAWTVRLFRLFPRPPR
jgi:uncharacterized membrane protein